MPEQDQTQLLLEVKRDISEIKKFISGEYPCNVSKVMCDSMEKISKAIEIMTVVQQDHGKQLESLTTTVFGKREDQDDTGLKGAVQSLIKEMRILKWVGGILAGTALAALVTYWINLMLIHGPL